MSRPCGSRCAFINCRRSARTESGLKLYRFPKDVNTSKQWILNCGNTNLLHLAESDLYKQRVCEHHFEENDFTSSSKHRLKKYSVPLPDVSDRKDDILHITRPTKTYNSNQLGQPSLRIVDKKRTPTCVSTPKRNSHSRGCHIPQLTETIDVLTPTTTGKLQFPSYKANTSNITTKINTLMNSKIDFPFSIKSKKLFTTTSLNTNNLYKLKKIIAYQQKLLNLKRVIISKLKKKLKSSTLQNRLNKSTGCLNLLKFPSEDSKTLVGMQIARNSLSTKSWSQKEQQFALSLFYESPSVYKFLRNSKKITLPGLTTINRWIESSNFQHGYNITSFEQLKTEEGSITEQEKYTLLLDELKIKHFLE